MADIRTKDLKKITRVKDTRTLQKYVDHGLIEKPILKNFGKGGGKGNSLFWPRNTIRKIQEIENLKQVGFTLSEIAIILKGTKSQ